MRRVIAVLSLVVAIVATSLPGGAQQAPAPGTGDALGGFSSTFGFGSSTFGMLDKAAVPFFVESAHDLSNVDPFTGQVMSDHAVHAVSPDVAITHDLMASDQLAFDALALAENARRQAEAAKARAQARARSLGIVLESAANPGEPEPWELKNFSTCGGQRNATFKARIEAVDAFEIMCRAAESEGVTLIINSAYRDPARQRQLWANALAKYGSAAAARKWVAQPAANGSCTSRHCAGVAIDVTNQGDPGRRWMHQIAGCYANGTFTPGSSCSNGQAVKRVQMYGFVAPMSWEPWHIQLGIPVMASEGGSIAGSCSPPPSYSVPEMIAAVFRCRYSEAGYSQADADYVVREALTVAKCESGWNAEAVVFGGRYVHTRHPSTGTFLSAAGVFQFIRGTADRWIDGGYANVKDPVANIDAAARLTLANDRAGRKRWADWACAMVNDGFAKKSVLPGYRTGPADFPAWAYQY